MIKVEGSNVQGSGFMVQDRRGFRISGQIWLRVDKCFGFQVISGSGLLGIMIYQGFAFVAQGLDHLRGRM